MPMLARLVKKPRKARAPAPFAVALAGANAELKLNGVPVAALPEGALWIASARTLIVSDLHLEKGSAFARNGQMLPPYDTRATLERLAALMDALAPEIVIALGDSFHDSHAPWRLDADDAERISSFVRRCDWIWILGNHDPQVPAHLGGAAREVVRIETLTLRHEPTLGEAAGEIAGHLHPCAKVAGRGRAVRRRCFATDGSRLVMPAFGAYAGALNVCDEAFAPIFPNGATALVLGRARVLPAAPQRLLPD